MWIYKTMGKSCHSWSKMRLGTNQRRRRFFKRRDWQVSPYCSRWSIFVKKGIIFRYFSKSNIFLLGCSNYWDCWCMPTWRTDGIEVLWYNSNRQPSCCQNWRNENAHALFICNYPLPSSLVKPLEIFRKYASLRPSGWESPRFFFKYHDGKVACQNVGINTIGKVPEDIAKFLNLENPEQYTGHSFRRSSALWLADSGADKDTIMRHGGWKSSTVAEGYIETSVESKKWIAEKLSGEQNEPLNKIWKISPDPSFPAIDITSSSPGVHLEHCYSCTINIHVNHNK